MVRRLRCPGGGLWSALLMTFFLLSLLISQQFTAAGFEFEDDDDFEVGLAVVIGSD